jgi:serine/threonine protein kinase
MPVDTCPSVDQLRNLLAEALPPQERAPLEAHVEGCPRCQQALERLTEDSLAWAAAAVDATAPTPLLELRGRQVPHAGPGEAGRTKEVPLDFLAPASRSDALGRLGHYEVLEVLGRGGFGIVLRAFDDKLQRVVAIKVLAPELAATSPARKRFLREARATAQVRHENVVQIHAVEEQPLPYLVMEFVPGETLQQRLDRTGPLEAAEVAAIGCQVADGLAAAHAVGLIHRDIKPGNILLESGPRLRAKLTDFGLARAADDASITQSGVVAGTPLYMSPEQARGAKLDQRSDLFSLGSVLYAITSGRPPFRAATTLAVLKRVTEETPRPIPEIIPETPPWLCHVIARLMAKEPGERFQAAEEVRQALEAGPTAPASAALPARPARPPRRRPPGWLLMAGGTLALAAVLVLAVDLASRSGTPTHHQPPPDKTGDGAKPTPSNGPDAPSEPFPYFGLRGTTISPNGEVLAAAVADGGNGQTPGRVLFWDAATGKPLGPPLLPSPRDVVQLAFSPDGKRLAVGDFGGTVSVWDVETRSRLRSYALDTYPRALEFSPDGKWLLAGWAWPRQGGNEGWVRLWDARTLGEARSFVANTPGSLTDLHAATFSPDGKQLAVGTIAGEIRCWDPATATEVGKPRRDPFGAYALRFDPSSNRLASGAGQGQICIWEPAREQPVERLASEGMVLCIAYSRDGKWLAWGTMAGRVYVRDQETRKMRQALTCGGGVRGLAFTPDGKRLITASPKDAQPPRVWDTETETEREVFQLPEGAKLP